MGKDGGNAKRVTVTLTKQQHATLEHLAKRNGVKVAWLVRRAVERMVEQADGGLSLPFDLK